jgi:hypothetical protein
MSPRRRIQDSQVPLQSTEAFSIVANRNASAEQLVQNDRRVQFRFTYSQHSRIQTRETLQDATVQKGTVTAQGGSMGEDLIPVEEQLVRLPPQPRERDRFMVLQKWEGTVSRVTATDFTAILHDLSDPARGDEEVSLAIDEVSESDRPLLTLGGVFYWSIGYRMDQWGSRERVSALRFRRLPVWTRRDIEEVNRKADELRRVFGERD